MNELERLVELMLAMPTMNAVGVLELWRKELESKQAESDRARARLREEPTKYYSLAETEQLTAPNGVDRYRSINGQVWIAPNDLRKFCKDNRLKQEDVIAVATGERYSTGKFIQGNMAGRLPAIGVIYTGSKNEV